MRSLKVSPLATDLRTLTDAVKHRLWVASPYLGSLRAVKRILGSAWQRVDVRLLLDKDSGILARDTVEEFAKHCRLRSLKGLHAKLYVIDDSVLLASANLTECAFTRRFEAGVVLAGKQARAVIKVYEGLWECPDAEELDPADISFTKVKHGLVDEGSDGWLPKRFQLPPDPAPGFRPDTVFADYPYFHDLYQRLTKDYLACGKRERPAQPLYLETDKFLSYLHQEAPGRPSKAYKAKRGRKLSEEARKKEIAKYRSLYRQSGLPGGDHARSIAVIQSLLHPEKIPLLTWDEVRMVVLNLNCFNHGLARARFLDPKRNDLSQIKAAWVELIEGSGELSPGELKLKMNRCRTRLFGFRAGVQEILAYYYPNTVPLRNANTDAGLRFLGYNLRALQTNERPQ